MLAVVVTEPARLEVMEVPMPVAGPYDCLVKIDACAVCSGTDSHIAFGSFPWRDAYPFVLGHESTGLIFTCGEKVKYFETGQRVTRPAAIYPGERVNGVGSTWGGFAEFGLVRDTLAAEEDGIVSNGMLSSSRAVLAGDVGPISAALSVNQREILSVVNQFTLGIDSRVVVVGSGYNGLLFALYCKHFGAGRVVMIGSARNADRAVESFRADDYCDYKDPSAAEQAKIMLGGHASHVIDAVGSKNSLAISHRLLDQGAAFGCYGIDDITETGETLRQMAKGRLALDMTAREADFVSAWYDLWRSGFYNRLGMCDKVMPLSEINQALRMVMNREAVKIVIEME